MPNPTSKSGSDSTITPSRSNANKRTASEVIVALTQPGPAKKEATGETSKPLGELAKIAATTPAATVTLDDPNVSTIRALENLIEILKKVQSEPATYCLNIEAEPSIKSEKAKILTKIRNEFLEKIETLPPEVKTKNVVLYTVFNPFAGRDMPIDFQIEYPTGFGKYVSYSLIKPVSCCNPNSVLDDSQHTSYSYLESWKGETPGQTAFREKHTGNSGGNSGIAESYIHPGIFNSEIQGLQLLLKPFLKPFLLELCYKKLALALHITTKCEDSTFDIEMATIISDHLDRLLHHKLLGE